MKIRDRPSHIASRLEAGHWESSWRSPSPAETAPAGLRDRIVEAFGALPASLRRTRTWDRGAEMAKHAEVTAAVGSYVYFCDPANPWQRGSNENANGLLRQYFPKRRRPQRHRGS